MPDPLHPHYDEAGVFFDAGFFYSDGLPVVPQIPIPRKRAMASLAPNLSKLNPPQLIALAELVASRLAPAAPATPPLPNLGPKVTALTAQKTVAKTANDAYEAARVALNAQKAARDAEADKLRNLHRSLVNACEAEAMGDETLLAQTGYTVSGVLPPPPSGPLGQVLNLSVTAGDNDGSVDVNYEPLQGVRSYEVQVSTTDGVAGPWTTKAHPTASRCTVDGLTSGSRVWVRVRGIGPDGEAPWSDAATKIVP